MKKLHLCLATLVLLAIASFAIAHSGYKPQRSGKSTPTKSKHVMVSPDELKWGPGPPALPAGAQLAVLEGDPSKAGMPFTIRAKMPDGYKIPPHWHPTDERVTVLEGSLGMGLGDKFDQAAGRAMGAGSYAAMPTGVRHFAWAIGETVIQVSAIGPFEVHYVNPADDPRKAK
jgi:hypothetical protein